MNEYTEQDMIYFALDFAIAIAQSKIDDSDIPNASDELKIWKTKNGKL